MVQQEMIQQEMVQQQNTRRTRRPGNGVSPRGAWFQPMPLVLTGLALVMLASLPGRADTLCVSPGGSGGCFSSISKAVTAADQFDTIRVRPGEYDEDVVIDKPLALIGEDDENTVIDAKGKANGIYIDGLDRSGLSHVVVRGFTVRNANFEGILVTNASYVTISDVEVINNDKNLNASTATCPGLPSFETAEGFDCGEGIHFSDVAHSIVAKSVVVKNSGGILLSDDTGRTHDNLISGNVVAENPFDCGITLASHPPAMIDDAPTPFGVFDNTIADNISTRNGLGISGAGAGVGIFDSVPGTRNSGNVVIHNKLTDNGLPGVALHSHTPGQNLDNNMIIGNFIAGNAKDTDDAATPGPTGINAFGVSPIRGLLIAENTIENEQIAIAVNTPDTVSAHLNNLKARTGVDNIGTGKVSATENWWGCSGGPLDDECSGIQGSEVFFTPWLTRPFKGLEKQEQKGNDHKIG